MVLPWGLLMCLKVFPSRPVMIPPPVLVAVLPAVPAPVSHGDGPSPLGSSSSPRAWFTSPWSDPWPFRTWSPAFKVPDPAHESSWSSDLDEEILELRRKVSVVPEAEEMDAGGGSTPRAIIARRKPKNASFERKKRLNI